MVVIRVLNRRIQIVVFVLFVRIHGYVARVSEWCQNVEIIDIDHTVVWLMLGEAEIAETLVLALHLGLILLDRLFEPSPL